jgi:hypothetical protein
MKYLSLYLVIFSLFFPIIFTKFHMELDSISAFKKFKKKFLKRKNILTEMNPSNNESIENHRQKDRNIVIFII